MSIVSNAEAAEQVNGNSQSTEPPVNLTEELIYSRFKYRLGGILAGLIYVPWGFLCIYLFNAYETIWGRFLVAILGITPAIFSYSKKFHYKYAEILWGIFLMAGECQMIYLGSRNDYHIVYVTGAFTTFAAISSFLSSQLMFVLASIVSLISIPIFGRMYGVPFEKWISLFFQLLTVYAVLGFSLWTKMKLSFGLIDTLSKLQDSENARAESAKMAALGTMAGGVAHEINNPLAIITGKAGLILRLVEQEKFEKDKYKASMEKIIETVTRIGKITKGLLMFSRNGENDPFLAVRIDTVIENTIELGREKFKDFKTDLILENLPAIEVECRETQVSQVVFNLMSNALDAVQELETKWVKISCEQENDFINIRVTDSGSGIPDKVAQKMMTPFYTTKEVGKGTGLGLSISTGIAQSHKGTLTYNKDSGHTQFVLRLPLRQSKDSANSQQQQQSSQAA